MSRKYKLILNIAIFLFLLLIFFQILGLYFTPLAAHRASERSNHYGPSEIAHVENFREGKYILCQYDRWVSCDTVKRNFLVFWSFGSSVTGFENRKDQPVDFSWNCSGQFYKVYGIVNDSRVKKIKITLSDGCKSETTKFYNNLFLFTHEGDNIYAPSVVGLDSNENIIYISNDEKLP